MLSKKIFYDRRLIIISDYDIILDKDKKRQAIDTIIDLVKN